MRKLAQENLLIILSPFLLTAWLTINCVAQTTSSKPIKLGQINPRQVAAEKNIKLPASLPQAEKIKIAQESLKGKVPPAKLNSLSVFEPVTLTTRNSVADDKAFLEFRNPDVVLPNKNYSYFLGTETSSLAVFFNAPEAGYFLVDIALELGDATMTMNVFGSSIEKKNIPYNTSHAVFLVEAKAAGWNMALAQASKMWKFYSCEIARVK